MITMLKRKIRPIMIIVAVMLCYHNSINCGLVFDDISAIKDNKDLRPTTPLKNIFLNDFWGTPIRKEHSHKSYRPLTVLSFRWNYLLHQLEPEGYHIVNIVLHTIVCLLYYKVCKVILPTEMSFEAAILFAVHPIHTEAVTGVVGRAEILSSVFFLAAFITYWKSTKEQRKELIYLVCFAMFTSCAMLSKEQGITVSGICAAYDIFMVHKITPSKNSKNWRHIVIKFGCSKTFKRLLTLTAITFLLMFGRLYIMGSHLPTFTRFDNPAAVLPTPERQLTFNYLTTLNIWLLLFPCDLCCDWTMGTIPVIESFVDRRNLATTFMYICTMLIVAKAVNSHCEIHRNIILMALAFLALPYLPASNLFFAVGFVIAERVLYIPSMGFCIIVSYGFYLLFKRSGKPFTTAGLVLLILAHGLKTYTRNFDWYTEYSLFMSGLKVNQRNAKLFNNVGHALETQEQYEEALEYFKKAVEVQRDDVGAYINVGRIYNHLKRYKEAEDVYIQAKSLLPSPKPGEIYHARIAPNHLNLFINLGNLISKNKSRLGEADNLYKQAISMRADFIQAYINRGDILMKLNRTKQAQEVYEKALLYDSENPDIYYNLGVVFIEQNKMSEALTYLKKALELNPKHSQALLNSAILLQELGGKENRSIAKEYLSKLLKGNENNEKVHFNMGMLAMDENKTEEAEFWFKRAITLKEDFRSALFNLALLLADANRPFEAIPFLKQLIKYHPDHIKGLILLGDIYINYVKNINLAEKCYRKILELDPGNIQGIHNLCVVYVERGKLAEALTCLKHANNLAPKEEYIIRHLRIVQHRLKELEQNAENVPEDTEDISGSGYKKANIRFNKSKNSNTYSDNQKEEINS